MVSETQLQAVAVVGAAMLLIGGIGYILMVASVDEGDRGVKKAQGAVTGEILDPGWHFPLIPFYHSVEYIETRPQTYTMSGDVHEGGVDQEDAVDFRSADQQHVGADITVRYNVVDDEVDEFHQEWNTIDQYEQRLLRPETIDTVAREASALNATEANSDEGRGLLSDIIADELRSESPSYVNIQSVQVRDIHFDPAFEEALEQVEIAQQEADAERTRADGDADAERIRAEGEADALREVQEALTEENLALEQIRAYDEGTVYVTDGGTPVILDPGETDTASEDSDTDDPPNDTADEESG